ncbi:MAG TPA: alkaline phosphatase family protein [Gemmatimonadaceae bacterium]|nr:alkaline phosphatase family protein [Gemmatimonadaceae bacterium]
MLLRSFPGFTRGRLRSRRHLLTLSAVVAGAVAVLGCMKATASAEGTPLQQGVTTPKLIVFITVDQLRGDMLARYRSDLRYGYARLMRGAWFTNGFQDHAITETAPGHASTMSGRFPRSTGITSNSVGVVDPNFSLIDGLPNEVGASPLRFQGTTLFDWLKAKDARTRALSVSKKDRGAILPIGRAKENIYWFSGNGSFTTSTYYRDTLPTWVREFNARRIAQGYAGKEWRLSRQAATYSEPDSVPFEKGGRDFMFPHPFPADTLAASQYVATTPTMDSITALFALEGLRQMDLGRGPQTDILAVSFSATDYVGHAWGPDSREAHENEMRLDETLGWFLDSLYKLRDSSTIAIALTGDHGVSPIPELARARGQATGDQGLRVTLRPQVTEIRAGLRAAGADTMAFIYDGETVALDRAALKQGNVNADSLLNAFTAAAKAVPGVARVDRPAALRKADFATDPVARRWTHQMPPTSDVELVMTLTRYSYWGSIPATHGTPYDQDANVPIIFYGPWVKPGTYTTFTRTVDMAPTLAAMTRVRPLEKLDGVVLTQALK